MYQNRSFSSSGDGAILPRLRHRRIGAPPKNGYNRPRGKRSYPIVLTTSSLLRNLGAVEDSSAIPDDGVALRLRIGPHCVRGGQYMSRWFKRTYRISAVIDTHRGISLVESEMPAELESENEGLAWLAEILRGALPDDAKPAWLLKGEGLRHLLRKRMSPVARSAFGAEVDA